MRPKSDLNQLMYADCRLCSDMDKNNAVLCKFHSPVSILSILAKYMDRKRMFYLCNCHAFLVWHDCLCLSNCTISYGVLHRFHYQLYTEKENRLYMHVYCRVIRKLANQGFLHIAFKLLETFKFTNLIF